MVGFNRRYAPLALRLKEFFGKRAQPASALYRANVGYRPPQHWLHDPRQGGGVIVGEACHHVDFCGWLIGAEPVQWSAAALAGEASGVIAQDNVHMRIGYADGSVATIAYLSNGSKAFPAEQAEVFCDNKSALLTDYRSLQLGEGLRRRSVRLWRGADRGHAAQIAAFLAAIRGKGEPIDTRSQIVSSRLTLALASLAGRSAPPPAAPTA
jgi:predicted dehydrogenase